MTSCKHLKRGDLVSWQKNKFQLKRYGDSDTKSEIQEMDFENEVCRNTKTNESLVFIPVPQQFDPVAHYTCSKFLGRMVTHITKPDLDHIVGFLSQPKIVKSPLCSTKIKGENNTYELKNWLAADDIKDEGDYRDWYTGQKLIHMPWAPNRPFFGEAL